MIDTESGKYDYRGKLSRDDYSQMVMDNFQRTNRQVTQYMSEWMSRDTQFTTLKREGAMIEGSPDIKYDFYDAEAFITDSKKVDVGADYFNKHLEKGDMFILIININPNSMDEDTESELRFWVGDSKGIHSDKSLDNKTKLLSLPPRNLEIDLGNDNWKTLVNCKILQDFSDKKYPYNFAAIIEKIK